MSSKLIIFLIFFSFARAQAGNSIFGSFDNREIKNQCAKLATTSPTCPRLPEPLNTAIQLCEAQMHSSLCQKLSTEEPEFASSMRQCDQQHFCEDELTPLSVTLRSCQQGWLEASGETLTEVGQAVAQGIESIQKNFNEKNQDIRNCHLDCKRVRAFGLKKYEKLSDEALDQISALTITMDRDEFLYRQRLKVLATPVNAKLHNGAVSQEQNFFKGVADWLERKNLRQQCLDATTRAEMMCWGAAYIIDPLFVSGLALKGFRSAKLLAALSREQKIAIAVVDAKKIDAEKVIGVESRTSEVIVLSEDNLIGTKLRVLNLPSLPKSMQVAEYSAADGSKYLALERTINLKNGKTVKSIRELPVDPITGAFDANFKTGKEFLNKILQDSDGRATVMLVDVNNLGDINKNFSGRMVTGDQHLKNIAEALKEPGDRESLLFKFGGDEFIRVSFETDPNKVKDLMDQMIARSHGPKVHELFEKERDLKINQFLETEDLRALQDRVPYLREGISVGASRAGRGEALETVVARAEDLAKKMKIEAKQQANISAAKYGGRPAVADQVPNTRYISKADLPAVGHDALVFPLQIIGLKTGIEGLTEKRVKELFRSGSMTVAQFVDEAGEKIIRVERYVESGKGEKIKSVREVFLNQRTGLIDLSHPSGQALAVEMAKVAKPSDHLHAIGIDIKNFGPVNYFKELSLSGDNYLVAATKVLEATSLKLGQSALNFKMNGAKFIMTGSLRPNEVNAFVQELNKALVNDPGIKKIFKDQENILHKDLKEAGQNSEHRAEIIQKLKDLEKIAPSFDIHVTSIEVQDSFASMTTRLFNP